MVTPVDDHYIVESGGILAAGRFVAPAWSPAAGSIVSISKAAGFFGTNGGATLAEINPKYQAWNPDAPNEGRFAAGGYYWVSINGYSGICWNTDTRQLVNYGAGHAAPNVCAPFCFDLNDLKWKWLDTPLPWTGYWGMSSPPTQAQLDAAFPNGEINYDWGEVLGDSTTWGALAQPGVLQPIPAHTRWNKVYIPASILGNTKGGMFSYGAYSGVLSGTNSNGSHIFDFDLAKWRRTTNRLPSLPSTYNYSSSGSGGFCDEQTKTMLHYGGGKYARLFNFETDSWELRTGTTSGIAGATDAGSVRAYPPARLLFCAFGRKADGTASNADGVTMVFAAAPIDGIIANSFSIAPLNVSVDSWPLTAAGNNTGVGWGYCPVDKCLYTVNGTGGSSKYWKLAPPANAVTQADYLTGTWTLTEHAFSSGTLSSASSQSSVYNRLSWDRNSRSFLWFPDSVSGPVQAFRPHGV